IAGGFYDLVQSFPVAWREPRSVGCDFSRGISLYLGRKSVWLHFGLLHFLGRQSLRLPPGTQERHSENSCRSHGSLLRPIMSAWLKSLRGAAPSSPCI